MKRTAVYRALLESLLTKRITSFRGQPMAAPLATAGRAATKVHRFLNTERRRMGFNKMLHSRTVCMVLQCMTLLSISSFIASCYGGLNPNDFPAKPELSGRVHFVRGSGSMHFPPLDSIVDLRVIAFKEIPRDTNVINTVLSGNAFFSESLRDTSFASSIDYSFSIPQNQVADSGVVLKYIVVGQQYGPSVFSDWRVVGIYSLEKTFTPSSLRVIAGQRRTDIDIDVDFLRLPPQPFIR